MRHARPFPQLVTLVVVASIAAALARPVMAQSAPDRTAIDSARVALAAYSNSARVLATLTTVRARTDSAKKDPVLRIELGWALLRAGVVTDSNDLILAAADAFWAAGDREPRWPYPWYGLGMAKAELAARRVKMRFPPHQPVGATWLEAAEMFFARAGKADPTYVPAATALGHIALNDNFDTEILPALQQLHPALDSSQRDPDPFLVLGRLAFRADSYAIAHAGFRFYLSRGGDSATGLFEDARALYGLARQEDASWSYYAGADVDSPSARTWYREDISWIADSAELQEYDTLSSAASRVRWLHHFWESRDAGADRRIGSRLAEHQRRYRYVVDHFPFVGRYRFTPQSDTRAYVPVQRAFDDRGVIYLRQGEPDGVASDGFVEAIYRGLKDVPNVSWLYFRPGGNLVFHFAGTDPGGWTLLSALSELGPAVYESRIDFGPTYRRLAMWFEFDRGRSHTLLPPQDQGDPVFLRLLRNDSVQSAHSIVVGTTTDAFPLRYPHSLEGIIQAYGAGGDEPETSRLLVVYALPDLRDVPYRTLPDSSVVYALRLRVQAADSLGHLALNTDSVRLIHAHRPLTKGQTLTGLSVLTLPPGDYRAKVMIADSADSIGGAWALADLPAPALDGPTLTLSDPILGREGSGLSWAREDGTIPLNPLNTFSRGSRAVLSYEVGGLSPGTPYTTGIAVRKFGADSTHNVISIAFPTTARGGRELLSKELGLGNLSPGRYLLVLTVSDATRAAERTRRIVIGR